MTDDEKMRQRYEAALEALRAARSEIARMATEGSAGFSCSVMDEIESVLDDGLSVVPRGPVWSHSPFGHAMPDVGVQTTEVKQSWSRQFPAVSPAARAGLTKLLHENGGITYLDTDGVILARDL
jgi:hypothetical protein